MLPISVHVSTLVGVSSRHTLSKLVKLVSLSHFPGLSKKVSDHVAGRINCLMHKFEQCHILKVTFMSGTLNMYVDTFNMLYLYFCTSSARPIHAVATKAFCANHKQQPFTFCPVGDPINLPCSSHFADTYRIAGYFGGH